MNATRAAIVASAMAAALAACDAEAPENIAENVSEPVVANDLDPLSNAVSDAIETTPRDRVSIDGTVVLTTPAQLLVDYGSGQVTVDLAEWQTFRQAGLISPGDRVIVTGHVDADLLAKRSLIARSIYVDDLHTVFYAPGAQNERFGLAALSREGNGGGVDLTGAVTGVSGRSFTLGTETMTVTVDTSQMTYDPIGGDSFQQVAPGAQVYVWGDLVLGEGGNARLQADGVVTLRPDVESAPDAAPDAPGGSATGNAIGNGT